MSWFSILILALALTSGVCSFLAVVIFRPDNTQLFQALFPTNIDKVREILWECVDFPERLLLVTIQTSFYGNFDFLVNLKNLSD